MLSHVWLIKDEVLKFCPLTREEASCNACCLILIERSRCGYVSMGVYQMCLISAVTTPQIKG